MKRSRESLAAAAQTVSEPRTPKQELLLKRRNRRKVDFKTMDGLLRESTRLYLDILNGSLSFDQAELRGRTITRHREILAAMVTHQKLTELTAVMRELEPDNTRWQALIDRDELDVE